MALTTISDRFDQPVYQIYASIEQLFINACSGKEYQQELDSVTQFYEDDFNVHDLDSQLKTFKILYTERAEGEQPSIRSMRSTLQSLSCEQRGMLDMVCRGFHILLVMPATNCTSERSFSALRRIKTYLRSTMSQARFNHLLLLLLHYHQDLTDSLDMKKLEMI